MSRIRRVSFIVRVVEARRGQVSGVVERVATGAKEAFQGMEAIGRVVARILQGERSFPGPEVRGARFRGRSPRRVSGRGRR
jgi:hypothetical protein